MPDPIQIVWGEWVEDSLFAFGRMREELYNVEIVNRREDMPTRRISRPLGLKERLDHTTQRLRKKRKTSSVLRQDTVVAADHSVHSDLDKGVRGDDGAASSIRQDYLLADATANMDADVSMEEPEPAMVRKERSASCAPARQDSRIAPLKRARSSALTELSGVEALLGSKPARPLLEVPLLKPEATVHIWTSTAPPPTASGCHSSLLSRIDRTRAEKLSSAAVVERKPIIQPKIEGPEDTATVDGSAVLDEIMAPIFAGCKIHLLLPGVPSSSLDKVRKNISDRGGILVESVPGDADYIVCRTVA